VTSKIFISYRRADSTVFAHLLHARLEREFGADRLFIDVDSIGPGIDFVDALTKAIAESAVVLVLIGRCWEPGNLHHPGDFVRLELVAALEHRSRIIPILLEGTAMPRPEELPTELSQFVRLNAVEISSNRLKSDLQLLLEELKRIVPKVSVEPSPTTKPSLSKARVAAPTATDPKSSAYRLGKLLSGVRPDRHVSGLTTTAPNPRSFAYRLGKLLSGVRSDRRVSGLLWLIAVAGFLQAFPMLELEEGSGLLVPVPFLGFFLTLVALLLTVKSFRGTSRILLLSGLMHAGAVVVFTVVSHGLTMLVFILLSAVPCANFVLSSIYNRRAARHETYDQTGW